ncbi:MAG: hypothetical protein ACYSWP_23680 [Planctomycetota bacterium]
MADVLSIWRSTLTHQMLEEMFNYVRTPLWVSFQQVVLLVGPVLLISYLMNYVAGFVERRSYSLMGRRAYLWLFGWLGTAIHELGHAFFCVVFRHKITAIKLFDLDPESGNLGYVKHTYNRESVFQRIGNFFIGIGPILFGSVVIYLSARYVAGLENLNVAPALEGESDSISEGQYQFEMFRTMSKHAWALLVSLFTVENLKNWRFYLLLYVAFCVGSSITLSRSDIRGAIKGLAVLILILFLLNFTAYCIIGDDVKKFSRFLNQRGSIFYAIMFFAIFLNISAALILLLMTRCKRSIA